MKTTLEWRSGGQAKSHVVVKDPGETLTAYFERVDLEFEAQLALYPPD